MNQTLRRALFFGVTTLALIVLVAHLHESFLPGALARQIGHNSEALFFALLVAGSIHLRQGLMDRGRSPLPALGLVAAILILAGLTLQAATSWPSSVVTLNEPLLGAGFVAVYLCLPRSPVLAVITSSATVAFIAIFFQTSFVLNQAESLVPLALAPLALDVFDRRILSPEEPDRPILRHAWMFALLAMVVVSMVAARWARGDLEGPLRLGIDYSQRAAEAYWGWLLLHAYFSYWLPARWLPGGSAESVAGRATRSR